MSDPTERLLAETAWLRELVRALVRPDDVDDVCQETLLATWRRAEPVQGNLRAWLGRVARSCAARDHVRRIRRQRRETLAAAMALGARPSNQRSSTAVR